MVQRGAAESLWGRWADMWPAVPTSRPAAALVLLSSLDAHHGSFDLD